MKFKYLIFALALACASFSWSQVPNGWVGPSTVLSISSIRWYGDLAFKVSPPTPNNDCKGLAHLEVPATSENINLSIMLSAMASGATIKLHYIGNACRFDAVQLCSDVSCPDP